MGKENVVRMVDRCKMQCRWLIRNSKKKKSLWAIKNISCLMELITLFIKKSLAPSLHLSFYGRVDPLRLLLPSASLFHLPKNTKVR